MNMTPINECPPDIEVEFKFNTVKTNSVESGYRPDHEIIKGFITTGVHTYYDSIEVKPGDTAIGTITFIDPEHYPKSMWIGREINICEGARIVGIATVRKVLNPIMQA